jgi:outer membrane protein
MMHMNRGNFWSTIGSALLLLAALPASRADQLSIFDQALINDPQIREAEALRLAQREARPQALAALLPQLAGSVSRSKNWNSGDSFSSTFIGEVETPQDPPPSKGHSTNRNWGINLRQNVFNWGNWVALRAANSEVAQAEADYLAQRQALAQRVAQQYFAVLQAQDTVRSLEAARDAISRQLEQAERRFEVGLIAITDVQEARAERDNSAANVIAAKRTLASAEEQLRATIGEKPAALKEPPEDLPLRTPNPAVAEDWVRLSMEQNASLISSRLAADIARHQVEAAFSGHLPSLDLSAGRNHNKNNGSTRYFPEDDEPFSSRNNSTSNGKSISLTLSVPLFSGGAVSSRKRQSEYLWIAAKERLERTSRTTERNARDAFLGVESEMARVQALKQAVESSRTALTATETGNEVGTRTAIDVLNARRTLVLAQTNYSAAKYDYLNSMIQLHLAAGDLDRDTIADINNLLTVTPAP